MMMERKAKTHKGKVLLQKYQPQINEQLRNTVFLRGTKSSDKISNVMQFLV